LTCHQQKLLLFFEVVPRLDISPDCVLQGHASISDRNFYFSIGLN
jgi:hypothetical protein